MYSCVALSLNSLLLDFVYIVFYRICQPVARCATQTAFEVSICIQQKIRAFRLTYYYRMTKAPCINHTDQENAPFWTETSPGLGAVADSSTQAQGIAW